MITGIVRRRRRAVLVSPNAGLMTDDRCMRYVRPPAASYRPSRQICAVGALPCGAWDHRARGAAVELDPIAWAAEQTSRAGSALEVVAAPTTRHGGRSRRDAGCHGRTDQGDAALCRASRAGRPHPHTRRSDNYLADRLTCRSAVGCSSPPAARLLMCSIERAERVGPDNPEHDPNNQK
jgi:hypothetical protein